MGTKPTSWADPNKAEFRLTPGIYKGIVKQIDTKTRTGRIKVYISEFGGNNPDLDANWQPVSYASPFGGYTTGLLNQTGQVVAERNDFQGTQQSYGFFTSPPDIGSIVLCCFPQGEKTEGYWFACVNPNLSQHMLPTAGAVPYDKIDPLSIPENLKASITPGFYYPCGEFNQNDPKVYKNDWATKLRPLHIPLATQLINQGLDGDPTRGPITTSAQRDPISTVYGFSSPGRPLGSQDPANNPSLAEALRTGDFNAAEYIVSNRVGGHSLIMDDGDIYNKNNLVRLRTAAGHQILMNDSEGFIYISNSKGTAWVELSKEGDVMIYSQRNLSVRTMGDMMFHSDRNIDLNARGSVQINAGQSVKMQAQAVQAVGKQVLNLYGQQAQVGGASALSLKSGGTMGIQSANGMSLKGSSINLNGSGGGPTIPTPSGITTYLLPDVAFVDGKWAARPNSFNSICSKVPTHEPYIRGSIAALAAEQEALADELEKLRTDSGATKDINGQTVQVDAPTSTTGAEAAANKSVTGAAPTASFVKQPDPKGEMGVLNQNELKAYMAQVGYNESGGKYDATNQFGYQGKYQMGAQALITLGYLKPGTPQSPEALNNPNNWKGKDGIYSSADFLGSPSVQEDAMYNYTKNNYARLQNTGLITSDTPADTAAGLLAASHLVGPGGPPSKDYPKGNGVYGWYVNGVAASDANKTTAETYFNRGKYSQTQVPIVTASNNSKVIGT